MLALSDSRRRPRIWLQKNLWSDRSAAQRSASLRRALTNIRKAFGEQGPSVGANRSAVWLDADVQIVQPGNLQQDDFLAELNIKDSAFQQWRHEHASLASVDSHSHSHSASRRTSANSIVGAASEETGEATLQIVIPTRPDSPEAALAVQVIVDRISEVWVSRGPVSVELSGLSGESTNVPPASLVLNLLADSPGSSGTVIVHGRLCTGVGRYFIWAGQVELPQELSKMWKSADLTSFINAMWVTSNERGYKKMRLHPYFQLQHAVTQLFSSDSAEIMSADKTLADLQEKYQDQPVFHAWRTFHRITEYLELGGSKTELSDEAAEYAHRAAKFGRANPLVLAILSQYEMKFNDDPDRAKYLAIKALSYRDADPYALSAASHASALLGESSQSYLYAKQALSASHSLPHEFSWDMQAALSALAVGEFSEAFEHARRSHLRSPGYRPALRYLIALSSLLNRIPDLVLFQSKLQKLEPDFSMTRLSEAEYPAHTLRTLGLESQLVIPSTLT